MMPAELHDGAHRALARPARRRATVSWLVDNAAAYRESVAAIERASRSIWLTQLAFDADCVAWGNVSTQDGGRRPVVLLDALRKAAARGVAVRIILNESFLLDTATPLRAALEGETALDIRIRGISRFPQLVHAKMLIVDEREAVLLGSPFVNGYGDDARHHPADETRPERELGGRPVHDLSFRVTGPPVATLGTIFAELWNDVSIGSDDDAPIECRPRPASRLERGMSIVRTAPRGVLRHRPAGVTEIVDEIERGLGRARRLVYVEHQYLSSRRVIAALARALRREAKLEVVVVLNQNPDVTAYRGWQNVRLRDAGLLDHPRVGVFALWRAAPATDGRHDWVVNQLFVHSKALIVDDAWVTAGSANLDGVSLHSYGDDFSGRLGRRVFRDVRNFDVNIVVRSRPDAEDNAARDLRRLLWAEHLGTLAPASFDVEEGGALWRWRAAAASGAALLNARPMPNAPEGEASPIVLPYSPRPRPREQLHDAHVRGIERLDVRFDPGWIERHLSPNWVRNMFA